MSYQTSTVLKWDGEIVKVQGKHVRNKSILETGLIVEGQAKLLCAIDYGYLAASITTASNQWGNDVSALKPEADPKHSANHKVDSFRKIEPPPVDGEVWVGTAVDYGPYVEFGTSKMEAQPFLRPALDLARGKVLTIVKKFGKFIWKDYLRDPLEGLK